MIEELGTDEEVEINGGILEVAEICNQNHFSGMNNLKLWVLLCVNEKMCRSDNSEASLPCGLPWRAEKPASLHQQPGKVIQKASLFVYGALVG